MDFNRDMFGSIFCYEITLSSRRMMVKEDPIMFKKKNLKKSRSKKTVAVNRLVDCT